MITDLHLEAMGHETVREWFALSWLDATSVGIGKQVARLELLYDNYEAWLDAMALPDTPESLVVNRRIAAIWMAALARPDYERRMAYPRMVIKIELGMVEKGAK